jgi:hypothetical protein
LSLAAGFLSFALAFFIILTQADTAASADTFSQVWKFAKTPTQVKQVVIRGNATARQL